MQNAEIAKIFRETAELLELKGENIFKVRAYQNAARNIENLPRDLAEAYKEGGIKALTDIPGIGQSIAEHIEEMVKTGKFRKYHDLAGEFPKGFLKLIEIPGLGPKTAMLLYKQMGIDSPEKLEKAAKAGKLAGLPGFGEKKQKNIISGIELKKKVKGRYLLSEAAQYLEAILAKLRPIKGIEEILPCGSFRRSKDTIGDLDILVTSQHPKVVMDTFVKLPQVDRVLAHGETKSSIVFKNGLQADLRVLEPAVFGSAAHYFTGSKQHNILIREMAIKKGLKVSEYGVFKGEKRIAGQTEEDVFKALGLPYIPPEIREGTGEIEAALKGELPDLIELKDIRGDLQMHSKFSDGANTIEEMVEHAKGLGYEYIAITDHTKSTRIAGGQSEKDFLKELEYIEKLNKRLKGFKVLKGVEVDILPDGSLDYKDEVLKQVDVVVAAVHSNFKMNRQDMTKRILTAAKNKYVNIISHPTGRLIGRRDPYEIEVEALLQAAKDTGTYLELNCQPERMDLEDIYCRSAVEKKVKLSIDTDAHSREQLNFMKFGAAYARRGWVTEKDVINTLPFDKLLRALYIKR